MAERLGARQRLTGMRKCLLAVVLTLPLLLTGCGDNRPVLDGGHGQFASPSADRSACGAADADAAEVARADLDGDGATDAVRYVGPGANQDCPAGLIATVGGRPLFAAVQADTVVTRADVSVVQLPGRSGQLLLIKQTHPRGGFQARLFGYAGAKLEELTVGSKPVLGFVATDVQSTAFSARCTDDGFEVLAARPHQPIGIVPAWDIDRTTYAVEGNTVAPGATTEIADNVLDKQLRAKYSELVNYSLFANCRVPG